MLEGSEALLQCEISNLVGNVQWVQDGFALGKIISVGYAVGNFNKFFLIFYLIGFAEQIPGYSRYSMIGDRNRGVFNLRIVNASIEDDAVYQCQVGPAKNSDPIRAFANLTVICEYNMILKYYF